MSSHQKKRTNEERKREKQREQHRDGVLGAEAMKVALGRQKIDIEGKNRKTIQCSLRCRGPGKGGHRQNLHDLQGLNNHPDRRRKDAFSQSECHITSELALTLRLEPKEKTYCKARQCGSNENDDEGCKSTRGGCWTSLAHTTSVWKEACGAVFAQVAGEARGAAARQARVRKRA
eukprot:Amastigsp_a516625_6.p2 type:complete len:175 gc:universal Amastigsp_a516625_6:929-405(-)